MSEYEWQPVRIAPNDSSAAHPLCVKDRAKDWESWAGKIVRVRLGAPPKDDWQYVKLVGCNATRFYDVHPDDIKVFSTVKAGSMYLCEHQILAD